MALIFFLCSIKQKQTTVLDGNVVRYRNHDWHVSPPNESIDQSVWNIGSTTTIIVVQSATMFLPLNKMVHLAERLQGEQWWWWWHYRLMITKQRTHPSHIRICSRIWSSISMTIGFVVSIFIKQPIQFKWTYIKHDSLSTILVWTFVGLI